MTISARRSVISRLILATPLAAATVVLAMAAPASAANGDAVRNPRLVTVTGVASREVTPDMATIVIGVTTRAPKAADALNGNSQAAAKVIAAVRAAGIESRDVQTNTVSISQNFRNKRDSSGYSQEPDGFTASNSVSLRVRDLGKLGPLLTAAAGEGANNINSLTFGYSGHKKVAEELQTEAVQNARGTAQRLVEAAGSKLGELQRISAGYAPAPRARGAMMMRADAAAPEAAPVEAGEMTITSTINATWMIE